MNRQHKHRGAAPAPAAGRSLLVLIGYLLLSALVATIGAAANLPHIDGWYATADIAPWSPPNWVFGPAWTLLYTLMAISAWLVWRKRRGWRPLFGLYGVQLFLNAIWSPLFFALYPSWGTPALWLAAVVIVLLAGILVLLIMQFFSISRWAAILLIPYLLWVVFASSLNIYAAAHN
ncbi:tryptophan-rich sensory protein [Acaricomes phytoseiuli]|uniref:TspO/MBR family protein n=1 Tax=Acaricomes phytoseiuli TaxID=291968 RepID=UPI000A035C6B|nr:TspO/MBR family protein [Acaricomes phytoseiuli]MCW1250634.1 tryptophan-rich sensory protein [Acaricomes phytoseiuli]